MCICIMYVHVGIQCSYIHVHAPNLVLVISYYYGLRLDCRKMRLILWSDVKIAWALYRWLIHS